MGGAKLGKCAAESRHGNNHDVFFECVVRQRPSKVLVAASSTTSSAPGWPSEQQRSVKLDEYRVDSNGGHEHQSSCTPPRQTTTMDAATSLVQEARVVAVGRTDQTTAGGSTGSTSKPLWVTLDLDPALGVPNDEFEEALSSRSVFRKPQ